jgi:hypothetical protein
MGLKTVDGLAAALGYQGLQAAVGDQSFGEFVGDTALNLQGVSGNVSPELQVKYQEIVTGQKIYRDPILGMVQQPDTGTLAGEPDLPDTGAEADIDLIGEPDIVDTPISDMPDDAGMPEAPTPEIPDRGRGELPTPDDDAGMPEAPTPSPKFTAPTKPGQSPRGSDSGGGGDGGCFLKGTQVTMADGSTKAIEQVDLGDNVAKGGKVFATGKFLVDNLHDYKGIKVSGSHMVYEDNKWLRVKDSKHGKSLGDDEHVVYVFGSENRRILINDILFTDYFEVKEQEKLVENEKYFFKNWKKFSNEHNESNVNILNAS